MNTRSAVLVVLSSIIASASALLAHFEDETPLKFSECPEAVQKTLRAEAKGMKIETVTKEPTEDGKVVYRADVVIDGKPYEVGVDPQGTLTEITLEIGEDQIEFSKCPGIVQATFHKESGDAKIESVDKDMKFGVTIYEAVVHIKGKEYEIVVAEDGTLVEKTLVVVEDEIELAKCPAAVQKTLRDHSGDGKIASITRSTGIGRPAYEASVEIQGKFYAIEVTENGMLISKTLEDSE